MTRLLWLEDEMYGLSRMLKPMVHSGYLVDLANDATEALSYLKRHKYDLIIIDLLIPEGNGYSTNEDNVGIGFLKDITSEEGVKKLKIDKIDPQKIIIFSVIKNPQIRNKIIKIGISESRSLIKGQMPTLVLKDKIDAALRGQRNEEGQKNHNSNM